MKLRRLRVGDELDGETVRGGEPNPDLLCDDAMRYYRVCGNYGISVFAIRGASLEELAQEVPLVCASRASR